MARVETTLPRLLAMLCILAVFIPAFFMDGAAKALFVPLALAVGFAMIASFMLSSTLVPVCPCGSCPGSARASRGKARLRRPRVSAASSRPPSPCAGSSSRSYLAGAVLIIMTFGPFLGTEIFPKTDTGQFALRFRAPSGTQVGITEQIAQRILDIIAEEAGGKDKIAISHRHGRRAQFQLSREPRPPLERRPGGRLAGGAAQAGGRRADRRLPGTAARACSPRELPDVRLSFEPHDIVSRVMSFGSPTPIEIAVSGPSLAASKAHAEKLLAEAAELQFLRDVQIAQTLDAPTVNVQIDRERAGLLGVNVEDVTRSLVAATTSSRFTVPIYWADPKTGISFNVAGADPRGAHADHRGPAQRARHQQATAGPCSCATSRRSSAGTAVGNLRALQLVRVVSITANIHGSDFGSAIKAVNQAIAEVGPAPDGEDQGRPPRPGRALQPIV